MSFTVVLKGSLICNSFEALSKFGFRHSTMRNSTILTLPEGWTYFDNELYDQNAFNRGSVKVDEETNEILLFFLPRFSVEVFDEEAVDSSKVDVSLDEQIEKDDNPLRQILRSYFMSNVFSFAVYDMYNGEEPIYISPKSIYPVAESDARSWLVEYIDKHVVSLTDDSKDDLKIIRTGEEALFDDPLFDPALYWEKKDVH